MKKRPPITLAAKALDILYGGLWWYNVVGVAGDDLLIVYTKKTPPKDQVIAEFVGYRVEFKRMGKLKVLMAQ